MQLAEEQRFVADQLRPHPTLTLDPATVDGHAFNIGRWIVQEWAKSELADVAPMTSYLLATRDRFDAAVCDHLDRGSRDPHLHTWAADWLLQLATNPETNTDALVAAVAARERLGLAASIVSM